MDVVGDGERVSVETGGVDALLEVVLGDLDLLLGKLVVVIGVEIERGNNVSKSLHIFLALCTLACRVRRAHIGRVFADDVADSHFVPDHLVNPLLMGD